MSRRYSFATCLAFGTDGEADYCEIDTTITYGVVLGNFETGPVIEDIRVEKIDGKPAVTGDAITHEAILAEFECGRHDADLLDGAFRADVFYHTVLSLRAGRTA